MFFLIGEIKTLCSVQLLKTDMLQCYKSFSAWNNINSCIAVSNNSKPTENMFRRPRVRPWCSVSRLGLEVGWRGILEDSVRFLASAPLSIQKAVIYGRIYATAYEKDSSLHVHVCASVNALFICCCCCCCC